MNSSDLGRVARRAVCATVLTGTLLVATACGAAEPAPETEPAAVPTSPTPAAAGAGSRTTTGTPKTAKIEVPSGVGLDYQSAQDRWRAAGLHVAPAKDATGANRIPVIDANWVVVSQSPKAGSVVADGSFITATVKKDTDD